MGERLETRRAKQALAVLLVSALAGAVLSACGGSSSGPPQLAFFVAIQPGGTIEATAERCTKEADGKYTIKPELLPNDASQAREQLVRRLGAKDSSIDIIGLDVILTSEFANAGWIAPWTGKEKEEASKDVFPSVLKTASFEGELYASPFNTNTQLLWYRKDLVPKPPETWDQMTRSRRKTAGSREDPGPGRTLRGLHGVGERADRKRRRPRSSPGPKKSSSNRCRPKKRSK